MPDAPQTFRVLVKTGERIEGASVVEVWEFVDCTREQHDAYATGDKNWRTAGSVSSWLGRAWRRIVGGDA